MVQKGVPFWGILTELPGSQTGLARGAWGGMSSPNHTLLATGKMGRGREWGSRASHIVVPWTWEPGGKGNCSFLRKWVTEDSPPGPPPGEGAASPEKEQIPKSPGFPRQGRFVDFLDDLGPGWDTGGTALLREARRATAKVSIQSSSGGRRRAPTVTGRLRPGPGGNGGWCITLGEGVLDRLGLLLYRRELLGKVLDGVAEQPCLGVGCVEKVCLVDVLHLYQLEPEMALLDHHGGHRLPEGPRRDFRRL